MKRSSESSSSSTSSSSTSDKGSRDKQTSVTKKNSKINRSGDDGVQVKPKSKLSLSAVDSKVLEELNSETFSPKQFASGKSKKLPDNIVIDLKKQTIKVPEVEPVEPDSIFHHNVGGFKCKFSKLH